MTPSSTQKIPAGKLLLWGTPVVLYAFLVVNGWLGADFGWHWDEHCFVDFIDDFNRHGRVIPVFYLWPSFCFYLTLLADLLFRCLHPGLVGPNTLLAPNPEFSVFSRCVFTCVASLTVVWVYLLAFKLTRKYWFALLAGLMFCSSFEFSYHSRWAVSDLIAVQFAFLSTLMLFLDLSPTRRIFWSAFIVGLAAGTKYTAGIVCLNPLIYMLTTLQPWQSRDQLKRFLWRGVQVGALIGLAFFITTPGCVYHLKLFIHDLRLQKSIYGGGHMVCDTMNLGGEHLAKLGAYFTLVLFSPWPAASVFISGLSLVGVVTALHKREWNLLGLFLVMAFYIAYVTRFQVMIVRNVMYVLPYLVVLAAYGLFALHERFKGKGVLAVDAVLLGLVALSLPVLVANSWSVYRQNPVAMKPELARYLAAHPQREYVFSRRVRQLLAQPERATNAPPAPTAWLVFVNTEIPGEHYPKIAFNRYKIIAGPRDVNPDYYPNWGGYDRVLIVQLIHANQLMLADTGVTNPP